MTRRSGDGPAAGYGPAGYGLAEEYRAGIRALVRAPDPRTSPPDGRALRDIVIIPGLGELRYLVPLAGVLSGEGHRVALLDLPGFGHHEGYGIDPSIDAVGEAAARWCEEWLAAAPDRPSPVLFGHSTGAQAALVAATRMQDGRHPPGAVVLAGPTVAPNQRSLGRMLSTASPGIRRDASTGPGRHGTRTGARDALRLLRSAIADRPERTVRELALPLLVTAGRQDTLAPPGWLVALAHAAPSRSATVVRLPGAHNNPFTHPKALASAVCSAAEEADRLTTRLRRRRSGAR